MNVTVEQLGSPEWPRYVVADDRGRYFDGQGWSKQSSKALLFYERKEAEVARQFVIHQESSTIVFRGKVRILLSDTYELTLDELKEYLDENAEARIRPTKGHPLSDVEIELELDFDSLGEFLD